MTTLSGDIMTKEEKKAFRLGFAAGFSISFDGWNGQVFKEFDRPYTESDEFVKALNKFTKDYEVLKHEQNKLPVGKSTKCICGKHERSGSGKNLNGAPTGSLPSPLYPRTILTPTYTTNSSNNNQPESEYTGKES